MIASLILAAAVAGPPARFESGMLAGHNAARSAVGVPALTWSGPLAAGATQYARQLAATDRFQHSPAEARVGLGENLWAGTAAAFPVEAMVGSWVDERRDYVHGAFPAVSRTGAWQDVGHYTAIVWRTTREVGCGFASNGRRDYVVCRYSPAGNVMTQRAY